jgi:hypothetical protein
LTSPLLGLDSPRWHGELMLAGSFRALRGQLCLHDQSIHTAHLLWTHQSGRDSDRTYVFQKFRRPVCTSEYKRCKTVRLLCFVFSGRYLQRPAGRSSRRFDNGSTAIPVRRLSSSYSSTKNGCGWGLSQHTRRHKTAPDKDLSRKAKVLVCKLLQSLRIRVPGVNARL